MTRTRHVVRREHTNGEHEREAGNHAQDWVQRTETADAWAREHELEAIVMSAQPMGDRRRRQRC